MDFPHANVAYTRNSLVAGEVSRRPIWAAKDGKNLGSDCCQGFSPAGRRTVIISCHLVYGLDKFWGHKGEMILDTDILESREFLHLHTDILERRQEFLDFSKMSPRLHFGFF